MKKTEKITHTPDTQHLEWNESYYFIFGNKKQNLHLMTRMGFKPNKKEAMNFMFIFLPDGSVAAHNITETINTYQPPFTVKNMTFSPQKDGSWKYKFQGKLPIIKQAKLVPHAQKDPKVIREIANVNMDVQLNPINDPYEYAEHMTAESLKIGKKSGDKHWEQIGKISGSLQVGNKLFDLESSLTIGQRDHTYGLRDWTGIGNWLYYVVWFNEHLCANPAAIITDDGRLSTGGFIFKDGENIPLKTLEVVKQNFDKTNIFPIDSTLKLYDFKDNEYLLEAKAGPAIPVPFKDKSGGHSILIQSVGTFTISGGILDKEYTGHGSYEVLRLKTT